MKKILVVSSYPAPYRVAVFEGLAEKYQMDVYFELNTDQNRNAGWFVKNGNFQILDHDQSRQSFSDALKHLSDYDLALAYDYNNPNAGRLMRACVRKNVPYIINCDGAFIRKNWLKDMVKRYYISHAKGCFASGSYAKQYFLNYGARPEAIHFHRFTSLTEKDIRTAVPGSEERAALRRELGMEDRKTVLTIGQFIPRKGFDVLLESWKKAKPDWQLILIGGGEEEEKYRRIIEENGLSHVILKGFMEKEDVFRYYMASDLFVLPTREDIWGLVINEAMACGLPIVSSDRCVAAMELVDEGYGGYRVPAEDADKVAVAMEKILEDNDLRQAMGAYNLEKIQGCTIANIVKEHIKVIETL